MADNRDMEDVIRSGELYSCDDPDLSRLQAECLELQYDYNVTRPSEGKKREELLSRMFAELGEGVYIEPPLHANWAGRHCHLGDHVYANFNLTLVDDGDIYIGSYTMLAPNVTISTAGHPINPELREKVYQYNKTVRIGRNCWIGAGCIILPGVTIGDNTVVGAGSVVTRDLPANCVAYGSPARIIREIGERDRETFFRGEPIDWEKIGFEEEKKN